MVFIAFVTHTLLWEKYESSKMTRFPRIPLGRKLEKRNDYIHVRMTSDCAKKI